MLYGDRLMRLALRPAHRAFAQEVEYRPQYGAPFQLGGVFNAPHLLDSGDGEVGFSTTAPTLGVVDADFPHPPKQNDRLVTGGRVYEVVDIQPDGPNLGKILILRTTTQRPDGAKPGRVDDLSRRITDPERMG